VLKAAGDFAPGHGKVDLFGLAERVRLGGALNYSHRLGRNVSAFAQGWAGTERDALDRWRADYGALGGLRWTW
jgi:hypothetical protein